VQGCVTYQSQPVVGAVVTFICQGASRFASGKTNAEGNYTLTTYEPDDGAVVGNNTVTVTMPLATPGESAPDSPLSSEYFDLLESSRKAEAAGSKLPKRYANADTSGLTANVTQGTNRHDFKLED
jgi:3',5'-cyclic AMP phosphodiesterase CpdA